MLPSPLSIGTPLGLLGYSRMYLNVHYPSDVLASAILGSGTAWLTWKANKKWLQRKKQKKTGTTL